MSETRWMCQLPFVKCSIFGTLRGANVTKPVCCCDNGTGENQMSNLCLAFPDIEDYHSPYPVSIDGFQSQAKRDKK